MAAWLTIRKAVNSSSMIYVPLSDGKIPQGYMGIVTYDVIWMANGKKSWIPRFLFYLFPTILNEINVKDQYQCNVIMEHEHKLYRFIVFFSFFLQKSMEKNGLKKQ